MMLLYIDIFLLSKSYSFGVILPYAPPPAFFGSLFSTTENMI